MIQVGDKFERNTVDNNQFIMKVIGVVGEAVHFKMEHKDPKNGKPFNYDMSEDMINEMIRQNKMRKL